jgi:hypothetical protein
VLPAAAVESLRVTAGHLLEAREENSTTSWNCEPHSMSGTVGQRYRQDAPATRLARASEPVPRQNARLFPCVQRLSQALPGTRPLPWALRRHVPQVRQHRLPSGAGSAAPAAPRARLGPTMHCVPWARTILLLSYFGAPGLFIVTQISLANFSSVFIKSPETWDVFWKRPSRICPKTLKWGPPLEL